MKVIATNIFDFTTWYKFGSKTISRSSIIDLSDLTLTGETLLAKTGFFEEEYEVFYLELDEKTVSGNDELFNLSLYETVFIIPLSESGARLLQTKIPDFKLSEPLEESLYQKLLIARNNFLANKGAKDLLVSFDIEWKPEYEPLQNSFLSALNKYKANLNAEQDTILDQIIFYERSKPYPLTDQGFLFDVGSVVRSWFRLSDDDFKNKETLKEADPYKYELIEQVICLSKFLQNKEPEGIWQPFINYYNENIQLRKLNEEIVLSETLSGTNNLLVIAFYFKFRDLIRNSRMLEDKIFTDKITRHLSKVPEETKIALLLNGLFFGSLRFKELHYKYVPLPLARHKFIKPKETIPLITSETKSEQVNEAEVISRDKDESTLPKENIEEIAGENIVTNAEHSSSDKKPFDQSLWLMLEPSLKKYHKEQIKKIKKSFDFIVDYDGEMFNDRDEFFISILKKEVVKSKSLKKETSKISSEMVEEIESKIKQLLNKE